MIEIKETRKCDIKTPGFDPNSITEEIVEKETLDHIAAVRKCSAFFAEKLLDQTKIHDHTKLGSHLTAFTNELKNNFKTNDWYSMHCKEERHHLQNHVPDDVNLIDVLEMIFDGVCAGLARVGSTYEIELPDEVLQKALHNTQKLIEKNIIVKK